MKPRKAVANGSAPTDSDSAVDLNGNGNSTGHKSSSLATDPLPTVKVNNANLGEIKGALDEIVKKVGRTSRCMLLRTLAAAWSRIHPQ
jgi:hypothetical protein